MGYFADEFKKILSGLPKPAKEKSIKNGKRCKHLNGILDEHLDATHTRDIENGVVDKIGYNEPGNLTHYEFTCSDCNKTFKWKSFFNCPKWAKKYELF
jgi:hypothetical protein